MVDQQRMEELVTVHSADLYRYVRYLGADRALADDIVQDVFCQAMRSRSLPPGTDERRSGAWLRGVARHLLSRHRRKAGRSPVSLDSGALEEAEAVWVETVEERSYESRISALRTCLSRLSDKEREFIDMFYGRAMSRSEIAAEKGMSEDGVKSALRRLRERLRRGIEARVDSERTK